MELAKHIEKLASVDLFALMQADFATVSPILGNLLGDLHGMYITLTVFECQDAHITFVVLPGSLCLHPLKST